MLEEGSLGARLDSIERADLRDELRLSAIAGMSNRYGRNRALKAVKRFICIVADADDAFGPYQLDESGESFLTEAPL